MVWVLLSLFTFFFFGREEGTEKMKTNINTPTSTHTNYDPWPLSHKPSVAEHLVHRGDLAAGASCWSALLEGRRENTCCAASQDATPTSNPCGFHTLLKDPRHRLGATLGQSDPWPILTETASPDQRRPRGTYASLREPSPTLLHWWCAFCCGVTHLGGEGTPTRSMTAPRHNVRPSATTSMLRPSSLAWSAMSRSRTNTFVDSPSFSADLCRCTLQVETSSTQNPCLRVRYVQEAATSASARTHTNGESEASTQQDSERLRIDPAQPCSLGVLSTWRMREGRTVTFGELDPPGRRWPHLIPEECVVNGLRGSLLPPSFTLRRSRGDSVKLSHSGMSNPASIIDNSSPHENMVLQTLASWCSTNERVKPGLTVQSQKFARVAPRKSNHPDWRSSTAGIRIRECHSAGDAFTQTHGLH